MQFINHITNEDVARQVHISSYEFHRAFSFLLGMTANAYIRNRRLSLAGREIVETKEQKFVALVRRFGNETINDEENHEIPDFWSECHDKNQVEPIRNLRPEGKRDLYGLCAPMKEGKETFDYGIGVLIDEETADFDVQEMMERGYRIWDVEPGIYVVFDCMGDDGDCISDTWARFYKEFLPQMGYEAGETTDYELYYEKGKGGVFCELWIPLKKHLQ